jgi:hypothetical protein
MATENPSLQHLRMVNRGVSQTYKSRPGRGKTLNIAPRDRAAHGGALRTQLESFVPIFAQRRLLRAAAQYGQLPEGITIEFQSAVGFDLAFTSLDLPVSGIELLNVRVVDEVTYATCYVPEGKLKILINKVKAYLEQETATGKAKNAPLIESIQSIGLATIEALWTDDVDPPVEDGILQWEVWLRRDSLAADACVHRFLHAAQVIGIQVAQQWIEFPERVVTNVQATHAQLASAIDLLNLIAEIRRADLPPALADDPTLVQQDDFVADLVARLEPNVEGDGVSIAILDTGIAHTHPLLSPVLDAADMHAAHPTWGHSDHHGHGTQMAGLALYGDLRTAAGTTGCVQLNYRLESVKVLPPENGIHPDQPLGAVMQDAVSYCETRAPFRQRIICQAITSPMHQRGEPSSYSGAVDQMAYGDGGDNARMFVIAGGNVPEAHWPDWPTANVSFGIEQPGQAWNALTVGASTVMQALPGSADYAGWRAIAGVGELGPFSATSVNWGKWPVKPEVLFEGGNAAIDPAGVDVAMPRTMQLLTTNRNHATRALSHTAMTSAATAQAARLSALVQHNYPDAWPETVRGLLVHHAEWTPQQRARFLTDDTQAARRVLLRTCGYGVPSEHDAIYSSTRRVCLIAQETLQPYKLEGTTGTMNELRIFSLPWPREVLFGLAEKSVRVKVTLSYFIEPSPSRRGWLNRYRYASHGLRFDLRRATETVDHFNKRVNAAMLAKAEKIEASEDEGWFLGSNLRTAGSIHSDQWTGMAVNLASRDLIAVYPVVGWWRECTDRQRCEADARFSLIVSLESEDQNVDLYNEIAEELRVPLNTGLTNIIGGN